MLGDTKANRRFAIFASVGDKSRHPQWLSDSNALDADRSFDLILVYYGDQEDKASEYEAQCDLFARNKGSKIQNLRWANRTWPALFEKYDAVWSLDDDIEISKQGIERCFELFVEYDLWLAQPAYSSDSYISHPEIQLQRPGNILRYTTFVECSVPIMNPIAWKRLRDEILENSVVDWITGSGVDIAYWHMLGKPVNKIAVFDSVPCRHPPRDSEMVSAFGPTLPIQEAWTATFLYGVPTALRNDGSLWPVWTYESLDEVKENASKK